MGIASITGQLFLCLSILIVLHEFGHFLPAKLFGTKVEKFYLFFNPWFSVFKKKVGETEYGLGWLPLGGYVKIAGMVDESFDTEKLKEEPKPYEFRSKPAWQRLIIMIGGVAINFLLGFLIFGMVLFYWGEEYLPSENAEYGIGVDSLGYEMGLRDGDKVLSVGGKEFNKFNDRIIFKEIVINNASQIVVERDGERQALVVDEKFVGELASNKNKDKALFVPRFPFVVQDVKEGMPAAEAGILAEDRIIGLNGRPTPFYSDFQKAARGQAGKPASVQLLRNSDTLVLDMTFSESGLIGVQPYGIQKYFDLQLQNYSLAQAIPAGFQKGWTFLTDQFKAFGQMFKGRIKASESLGGFGTIAGLFSKNWDWETFWRTTAIISLILAFMNLLPIPALDGGHVFFLLVEMVSGRKPSDKFMEYATLVGFIIIIGLVLYANGLDVYRAIVK